MPFAKLSGADLLSVLVLILVAVPVPVFAHSMPS